MDRVTGQVRDARVLPALVRLLRINGQHAALPDELADRRQEQRSATVARARFDDPLGPDTRDHLLVGHQVRRRLGHALTKPCGLAPRVATPERVHELDLQLLWYRYRLL